MRTASAALLVAAVLAGCGRGPSAPAKPSPQDVAPAGQAAPLASAALAWAGDAAVSLVSGDDGHVVTQVLRVRNAGARPLELLKAETDCPCLTATVSPSRLEPGAEGSVALRFAPTENSGLERKELLVWSRAAGESVARPLSRPVSVGIAPWVEIAPSRSFTWALGSEPAGQVCEIAFIGDRRLRILSASAEPDTVVPSLETVEEGRRYRLRLSPRSTATRSVAAITLTTDSPYPFSRTILLYAGVRTPRK